MSKKVLNDVIPYGRGNPEKRERRNTWLVLIVGGIIFWAILLTVALYAPHWMIPSDGSGASRL